MHNSEYNTFKNNIMLASTVERLTRLERSLDNLFKNGIFTPEQFSELDGLLMDKLAEKGV